jgi:DNA processing protein
VEPDVAQIGEWLQARARRLEPDDAGYPAVLGELQPGAGPLWVVGELPVRCIAVVGSRQADLGGLQAARALGRGLAAAGWAVVSGGAVGCDAAAHEGALEAGGATIVVLGSGLARPYPRENADLMRRAAEAGAVLTPYAPEVDALPGYFHRRNRIIAALGAATVVVRAGHRSGALDTAAHALRLGRPVLVVPGSPGCASAEGSNRLLREGCPVVLEAADVLRAVAGRGGVGARGPTVGYVSRLRRGGAADREPRAGEEPRSRDPGGDDPLLVLIGGGEPAGADDLAAASGIAAGEVAARLGMLEAEGKVARLSDGRFRVVSLGGRS